MKSPVEMNVPVPRKIAVAPRLVDFMRQADRPELTNLAAGIPSDAVLPLKALKACTQKVYKEEPGRAFAYHSPEGNQELRECIATRLRVRGVKVRGQDVVITTGCTQAIQMMLALWVQPGDIVATESPAYYGMLELLAARGARVLPLPTDPQTGLRLGEAEKLLKRYRPKCLVVCSSLSNPSGATIPVPARREFAAMCGRLGVRVLEDDIYSFLCEEGAPKPIRSFDAKGENTVLVSSFSKTVAPGLRIGYMVPGPWFEDVARLKCQQDIHSSVISEFILKEMIKGGHVDHHMEWLRKQYARRRAVALRAIEESFPQETFVTRPVGGYMLWAELPVKIDLAAVQAGALRKKVIFSNGSVFFPQEPRRTGMRLNCARADEADLDAGLRVLGGLLKSAL